MYYIIKQLKSYINTLVNKLSYNLDYDEKIETSWRIGFAGFGDITVDGNMWL
jgi:hypothetical protein